MSTKIKRTLETITHEIQKVMKRETLDLIAIGVLLTEAQAQLQHGAWLPWLKVNFALSVRTAENYMNAARFAENRNVANLKLRASALYRLGESGGPGLYSPDAIEALLKAAETEWIDRDRVFEIACAFWNEKLECNPSPLIEPVDQEEIDKILDGPPPDLPPSPPPAPATSTQVFTHTAAFNTAISNLLGCRTKPLKEFISVAHTPDQIRAVAHFLLEVADRAENQKKVTMETAA